MSLGLLLTALGLGLRHGIDWDHIAAIADLSSTTKDKKRGFALSMAYAVGHGAVVFVLGTFAILFGLAIPDSLDEWMGRIVGVTLVALGAWILVELARKGKDFRLRSRWMLVLNGTFAGFRRVRQSVSGRQISVEHEHNHTHVDDSHSDVQAHDHAHAEATAAVAAPVAAGRFGALRTRLHGHDHSHAHRHDLTLPDDPDATYGHGTATGIGMLHGVGIESPTQIAIFVASTAAVGVGFGLMLLGTWVLGLIIANAFLATVAGAGLLNAEKSFPIYAALAVVLSIASIVLGVLFIFGLDILPALN